MLYEICILQFDTEISSCYYSASHTDNISTDEHDSLRDHPAPSHVRGLQSSDSGADLSEFGHAESAGLMADEDDWHKYWLQHGDELIWQSWINKYKPYINPEYFETKKDSSENTLLISSKTNHSSNPCKVYPEPVNNSISNNLETESNDSKDNDKNIPKGCTDSSGESEVFQEQSVSITVTSPAKIDLGTSKKQEIVQKNQMLIRNLSGSDSFEKLSNVQLDGWNQLSPVNIDCGTEIERLLGSRCGSVASSTARTVGTTDSMTNVTRMTVSSVDLSDSSKSSIPSPISSIQSSENSSSEEVEDTMDSDQYWQELWKQHYEEQYLENYNKFVCQRTNATKIITDSQEFNNSSLTLNGSPHFSNSDNTIEDNHSANLLGSSQDSIQFKYEKFIPNNKSSIVGEEMVTGSMEYLMENLEMQDGAEDNPGTSNNKGTSEVNTTESMIQLGMYGLPMSFGKQRKNKRSRDDGEEPPEERSIHLKRR